MLPVPQGLRPNLETPLPWHCQNPWGTSSSRVGRRLRPRPVLGRCCRCFLQPGSVAGTPPAAPPGINGAATRPQRGVGGAAVCFSPGFVGVWGRSGVCSAWTGATRAQGPRVTLNKST